MVDYVESRSSNYIQRVLFIIGALKISASTKAAPSSLNCYPDIQLLSLGPGLDSFFRFDAARFGIVSQLFPGKISFGGAGS